MKTRVTSKGQAMSGAAFRRAGGNGSGTAYWWLKRRGGDFVRIPKVEGRESFDLELEIPAGEYVLGTGRGRDGIRVDVSVKQGIKPEIKALVDSVALKGREDEKSRPGVGIKRAIMRLDRLIRDGEESSQAAYLEPSVAYAKTVRAALTKERSAPVSATASTAKTQVAKSAAAIRATIKKEPRGRTARAVAGLPPLKPKKDAKRPLSRRTTLGTICDKLHRKS